jgi:NAD(P)-dependent dehydrogenase (short-subunit alcohol dehydrogenase family)
MRLVLADIEEPALATAERELRATGADVLAMRTDVSNADDLAALADRAFAAYGAVHLLVNNAGVAAGGGEWDPPPLWEQPMADWEWVLGVNLLGVVHGVRAFVPRMLAQGGAGHIVNTASIAGLLVAPQLAIYSVSKHAVVAFSEALAGQLAARDARLGVSVLCPGWVQTRIMEAERNRPDALARPGDAPSPAAGEIAQALRQSAATGMPPEPIADAVFGAVRDERFYILTHPEMRPLIERRMERILNA